MKRLILIASLILLAGIGFQAQADQNAVGAVRYNDIASFASSGSSEISAPTRVVTEGDIPAGYRPTPALPVYYEPPQVGEVVDQEGLEEEPLPLWGPDVQVYAGALRSPAPIRSERMIAYDQSRTGILYAAFVVSSGDTARIYRSTDGGNTWAPWNYVAHTGNVLSSLELVVAEGDSSFVFLFLRTSAGNGDIYCARFQPSGGGVVFPVKADSDTIVNLSACWDFGNPYYLYVTFELRNGQYNVYTYRSTNYGVNWAEAGNSEVADNQVPPKPDICCGYNNRIFVFLLDKRQSSVDSASFRVKISTDRGTTWLASAQVGMPSVRVYDGVAAARRDGPTVWLVHVRNMEPVNGRGEGVFYYYSTDNGATWNYGGDDGIGHADTDNNEVMPSIAPLWRDGTPTVCYAIVPSESLMFTWCWGDTNWATPIKVNDHWHAGNFAPAAGWKTVGASSYSTVLYAGVGPSDLWFDAFDLTGVKERHQTGVVPVVVVKPNPAGNRAVINWTLNQSHDVVLTVHDVLGRPVAVLAQVKAEPGTHQAVWNCKDVPAGVYLYRLSTGRATYTGQIVVSR